MVNVTIFDVSNDTSDQALIGVISIRVGDVLGFQNSIQKGEEKSNAPSTCSVLISTQKRFLHTDCECIVRRILAQPMAI
jgi:hypothetical protein